jgi:tetratricopeptide (TPR) repeat protein
VLILWALLVQSGECPLLLAQAQKAFQSRDLPTARSTLDRALGLCADRVPIYVSLGQIHYLEGKELDAEKQFQQAITLDPNQTEARYHLGRLNYQQHRYPEAIEQLLKVVTLDPANHKAHDNLALCYDALRRDADALRHFKAALTLVMKDHPTYDWAHANLADFLLRREQFENAFQFAAEAARRNPASARNAFLTGKALVKLDKHELSLRWLEQAVKLDPAYSEAWYLLAQTYRKLSRAADADRALTEFKKHPRPPAR